MTLFIIVIIGQLSIATVTAIVASYDIGVKKYLVGFLKIYRIVSAASSMRSISRQFFRKCSVKAIH